MSNVIYNHAQSLCDCYDCNNNDFDKCPGEGCNNPDLVEEAIRKPSNMSLTNCKFDDNYWNCFDTKPFRMDIEPVCKKGLHPINPEVITEKYAKGFADVSTGSYRQITAPYDGRLVDVPRGSLLMRFHSPPIDGKVRLDEIYDDKYTNYGQGYTSYDDINAGQILYYNDASIEDPFFGPNYVTSAWVDGYLYKDPMTAMKPQYMRTPVRKNDPIRTGTRKEYEGGLSWLEDSLSHRQDIMSLQMRKGNEQRWMPRWNNSES